MSEERRCGRKVAAVVRRAAVVGLVGAVFAATAVPAYAGDVAIYGPTNGNEAALATAAGHNVTIIPAGVWGTMTTAQFAAFDALVLGDPFCSVTTATVAEPEGNRATWSAAVTGNIVVNGTDPSFHQAQGDAMLLATNSINWAASGAGTGLYVSLSCYYAFSPPGTPVPLLDQFGVFTVQGQFSPPFTGCPGDIEITMPGHPVMAGVTEAGLSNWGCSPHEGFNSFPADFDVLARERPSAIPYILGRTGAPRVPDHFLRYQLDQPEATGETVTLVDQFGELRVRLEEAEWLWNPTEKRRAGREPVPIERPDEHLVCYGLPYIPTADRFVTVRNQFIESRLRVGRPLTLCTPASKSLSPEVGPPPEELDHYLCYDVRGETPLFPSETLVVRDQFGERTIRIDRARELCNPVEKRRDGREPEPILRPEEHYVCYRITIQTPVFTPLGVFTRDQFAFQPLRVTTLERLCVPSTKDGGSA